MKYVSRYGALAVAVAVLVASTAALAAGEKVVVYGADTSPAERQELAQLFGADQSAKTDVVTTQEMVGALQGSGLPVAPTDRSVSSSGLTCLNKGDGLTVRTQNITRITAPVYANALVVAGVGDGNVIVAAPQANPVSGETALVGVLKAFPQCQAGRQPDQARVRLAYEQVTRTVALAGPSGDLTKASAALLQAAQPVVTGQARDDTAIGAALDGAVGAQGIQVPAAQRGDLVGFLKRLSGLDYGTYAQGYSVQQVSPNEVRVVPAGAGAPGAGGAGAQGTQGAAAAGSTFTGEVRTAGQPLTVRADGQDRQVGPGPDLIVTRDGKAASLGDIKKGDEVKVTTNPDGSAQRIDATSKGGAGWLKWLLPLLIGLALLGLLLWFLAKRRRDSFVLEPRRTGAADRDRRSTPRT